MVKERTIIQTGIGLEQETLARCDRLRACYGRSRSWVIERALAGQAGGVDGGLAALEREQAATIAIFDALAAAAGVTWQQYAQAYVEAFGAKTYPPGVQALEAMGFTGRETRQQLERKMIKAAGQAREARRREQEERAEADAAADVAALPQPEPAAPAAPARRMSLRDLRG